MNKRKINTLNNDNHRNEHDISKLFETSNINKKLLSDLGSNLKSIEKISNEKDDEVKKKILKSSLSFIEESLKERAKIDLILKLNSIGLPKATLTTQLIQQLSEDKELIVTLGRELQKGQSMFKIPLFLFKNNSSTDINLRTEIRDIAFKFQKI